MSKIKCPVEAGAYIVRMVTGSMLLRSTDMVARYSKRPIQCSILELIKQCCLARWQPLVAVYSHTRYVSYHLVHWFDRLCGRDVYIKQVRDCRVVNSFLHLPRILCGCSIAVERSIFHQYSSSISAQLSIKHQSSSPTSLLPLPKLVPSSSINQHGFRCPSIRH